MDQINIAIIGCGAVAEKCYAPALKELERLGLAKLVSAVDHDPKRLDAIKSLFENTSCGQDAASLLDKDIALAIIASPVSCHAEQAIALLRSGTGVLCEKPMAATTIEAEAMIRAAKESGSLLAIGLFRRYLPAARTIKQLLEAKTFGRVKSFYFEEGAKFDWPIRSPFFSKAKKNNGGILLDVGIHLIDLMLWWFGEPDEIAYEDDNMGGIELNARLQGAFKEGFKGEIRLSWDWPLTKGCVIECEKGWIKFSPWNDGKLECGFNETPFGLEGLVRENKLAGGRPILGNKGLTYNQSFVSQLCNVISALRGEKCTLIPGEEGIKSLKVVEHCYQHRTLMTMPWLSDKELAKATGLSQARLL